MFHWMVNGHLKKVILERYIQDGRKVNDYLREDAM